MRSNIRADGSIIPGRMHEKAIIDQRINWITSDRREWNVLAIKAMREYYGGRKMSNKGYERMIFFRDHYGWKLEVNDNV